MSPQISMGNIGRLRRADPQNLAAGGEAMMQGILQGIIIRQNMEFQKKEMSLQEKQAKDRAKLDEQKFMMQNLEAFLKGEEEKRRVAKEERAIETQGFVRAEEVREATEFKGEAAGGQLFSEVLKASGMFPKETFPALETTAAGGKLDETFKDISGVFKELRARGTASRAEKKTLNEQEAHTKNMLHLDAKITKLQSANAEQLGGKMSAAERTSMAESQAALDNLNSLKTLFEKSYVGPIAGRFSRIKDAIGFNSELQSQFIAATAAFTNAVIKEITGAQMGEAEADRIKTQIPSLEGPPTQWLARWKQSVKNLETLQKRKMQVLRQSGITPPIFPKEDEDLFKDLKTVGDEALFEKLKEGGF